MFKDNLHTAAAIPIGDPPPSDPMSIWDVWWPEAKASVGPTAGTMFLATVDAATGRPSCRPVALKALTARGVVFFSNTLGRKAKEMTSCNYVAVSFYWPTPVSRSVRVEGKVSILPDAEAVEYFARLKRDALVAMNASPQSTVVASRAALKERFDAVAAGDGDISRPPDWGGFLITPDVFEFWEEDPVRMHTRIRYDSVVRGTWNVSRLFP